MDLPCAALILAAGLSERMGRPKAMLRWDASITFLEKIIAVFQAARCSPVICTINQHLEPFTLSLISDQNLIIVLNEHPERGRLYSIKLGLEAANKSGFCFIQNVDNPFINAATIRRIFTERDPGAWCSPTYQNKQGHPVLVPRMIIEHIINERDPEVTLQQILQRFPKKNVETGDGFILGNINTPEDYRQFLDKRI